MAMLVLGLRQLAKAAGLVALAYLALLLFPRPLFAHSMSVGRFQLHSDRPIPAEAARRLIAQADARLGPGKAGERFALYFCNDDWRLWLLSQHFSSAMGGSTDTLLTGNIYLRRSRIDAGQLVAPGGGPLADAAARPLAYFVAHEAMHRRQMLSRGRVLARRWPAWLVEGEADWRARGGVDVAAEARAWIAGDERYDPIASGLYRRHALLVAALVQDEGRTLDSLYANPPDEAAALARLRARYARPAIG